MFTRIVLHLLWLSFSIKQFEIAGESITSMVHITVGAKVRDNTLKCYKCDTMDVGELCVDVLTANTTNATMFHQNCVGEEFICMVKRFSYTTSNENTTSSPKMWSLDRRCTVNCEPGCIVIGERTKLYACTSCCESNLCNTGKGSASSVLFRRIETGIGTVLGLTLVRCFLWYIS